MSLVFICLHFYPIKKIILRIARNICLVPVLIYSCEFWLSLYWYLSSLYDKWYLFNLSKLHKLLDFFKEVAPAKRNYSGENGKSIF